MTAELMHPKARFARPLLALVVLAPFVGEILSSNVPASLFFLRPIMILFAALTYSLPVLLIRELAVARRLSHPGLLICGLAYGIFNEGILARTLVMSEGLPIPTFNHYFSVLGLNVAWAITLLVWHALFSVATPVLVVHWLWPDQAGTRWLSKGWIIVTLGVICLTSLLFFRADEGRPPSGRYFLVFVGTIIALIGLAATCTGGVARGFALSWRAAIAGVMFFVFFGGLFAVSALGLHPAFFLAYAVTVLIGFAWYVLRKKNGAGTLLFFCIGNCASYSLFVFLAKLRFSPEGCVVSLMIACGYALLFRRARRAVLPGSYSVP